MEFPAVLGVFLNLGALELLTHFRTYVYNPGDHLQKCRSPRQEKCAEKSASDSAARKRGAEESAKKKKAPGPVVYILLLQSRAFFEGGDLNPEERHSCDTRDDGTVTLCSMRATTVLSRNCCADFGRPLARKVMSHSRDGPGVTAPLRTNIVPCR